MHSKIERIDGPKTYHTHERREFMNSYDLMKKEE